MIKKKIQQVLDAPKDNLILATVINERIVRIHPEYEKLRKEEDEEEEKSDTDLYAFEIEVLTDSSDVATKLQPSRMDVMSENYIMVVLNLSVKVKIDSSMFEKRRMP